MNNGDPAMVDALAKFPNEFGLRPHHGNRFRVCPVMSYMSDGDPVIVIQIRRGEAWIDFSKGSVSELRSMVVAAPTPCLACSGSGICEPAGVEPHTCRECNGHGRAA